MSGQSAEELSWDDVRPALGRGVTVDAPLTPDAPWVISVAAVPRARVSGDLARLAARFDGLRSLRDAAEAAGVSVAPTEALAVVDALADAGLLRDDDADAASPGVGVDRPAGTGRATRTRRAGSCTEIGGRSGAGRFRYRPPFTLQWSLVDPSRAAAALARSLHRRAVQIAAVVAVVALAIAAVVSAVTGAESIVAVLAGPVPLTLLPVLAVAVVLTGLVHELGHAVALAWAGGRPARLGIMLFYFMPAFFCDVTDGWRLGSRRRRAAVALAGPAVHLVLAFVSTAALLAVTSPGVRAALVLYATACAIAVVANLVPFLALDGYLALVAITDTPFLRRTAMTAARRAIGRLVLGVDLHQGARSDRAPLVVFGVFCVSFPLFLFVWAALRLAPAFLELGVVTAGIFLMIVALFLGATGHRIARLVAESLHRRAHACRVAAGIVGVAVAVGAVLLVPVPAVLHAGFVTHGDDVLLVLASPARADQLSAGDDVVLRTDGIALRPELGRAALSGDAAALVPVEAPLAAFAPVSAPGLMAPAWGIPLTVYDGAAVLPSAGLADVDLGRTVPVGVLIADTLVISPVRVLLGGGPS